MSLHNKNAKYIALIGLDGSGKSANIDIMKKDRDYEYFSFIWVRWKPALLKPLYIILNKSLKNKKNSSEHLKKDEFQKQSCDQIELNKKYSQKSGIKEKIFKISIVKRIWLLLAVFDYVIQFYAKVSKHLRQRKSIIFDRYYLDLFVDQGINFRFSPCEIGAKIDKYQWMFPKMDKVVYIRVSPQICYKRKDDIPNMEYLKKRYEIYEYLAKKDKWIVVDGEKPLDDVNAEIKQKIFCGDN